MTLRVLNKTDDRTRVQVLRYGFVAVAAFAVDYTVFALLVKALDVHYLAAAVFGFCAGVCTNYAITTLWVFNSRRVKNRGLEFLFSVAIASSGLVLNLLILWVLTSRAGFDPLISKLISTAAVFFWNFFMKKKLLYTVRGAPAAQNPLPVADPT